MTLDGKYRLGQAMMWVGIVSATVCAVLVLPVLPYLGLVGFLVSVGTTGGGVFLRKKYCPRCRAGQCELPEVGTGSENDPRS